ncbi:hypothetical protein H7I76_04555, partial [Mycolicibacterium vaccae]|nr:hypothetical protein [Mycolicibacterium vaccae]
MAGWIKRGPTGFIGTNKSCSLQTVQSLVADFNEGLLTDPVAGPRALARLVHARQPDVVDAAGWRAIDEAERERGKARERPATSSPRSPTCWPSRRTRATRCRTAEFRRI